MKPKLLLWYKCRLFTTKTRQSHSSFCQNPPLTNPSHLPSSLNSTSLPINACRACSLHPALFASSYCMNTGIRLTKKRHHFFGSVRSPSVLFWPHVQHGECLLPLTSTRVENKHLARQRSINNTPSLCCPRVSAAAAFCYFAVLLSLSFVVYVHVCVCVCVYEIL